MCSEYVTMMQYYAMDQGSNVEVVYPALASDFNNVKYSQNQPMDQSCLATPIPSADIEMERVSPDESIQQSEQPCSKLRRVRTAFTSSQLVQLESEFMRSRFLSRERRISIAQKLSVGEKQVKLWFQNRRAKQRRALKGPNTDAAETKAEKMERKGIVQRSMPYSPYPAWQNAEKRTYSTPIAQNNIIETKAIQSSIPQPGEIKQAPNPQLTSLIPDFNEIYNQLSDNSSSSSHNSSSPLLITSSSNSSYDLEMMLVESIKQDLEMSAEAWLRNTQHGQWSPNLEPKVMQVNLAHMNPSDMYNNYNINNQYYFP